MRRLPLQIARLGFVVTLMTSAGTAQESYDGRIDIAAQLAIAIRTIDTAKADAVILSEGRSVTWSHDGRMSTLVHRILLVNSNVAGDLYADNRIPFDQEHCTFTPLALRTWRDNRWWPTDSTGIVETLPFALEHAVDYAGMREMMLLHNGVEVPCILELAYRIDDKAPYRRSIDGVFQFQRDDPAVRCWLELAVPRGTKLHLAVSADVPPPVRRIDQENGMEIVRWEMGPSSASPLPHTVDQAAELPHVAWTVWSSWTDLGAFVQHPFQSAGINDPLLIKAADSLIHLSRTFGERVMSIARFVNDRVTYVNYPESYWWSAARTADQVYNSAYGHRLDRAVLASALFRRVGVSTHPLFVSKGTTPIDSDVPSLAPFEGIDLLIEDNIFRAVYHPNDGTISYGDMGLAGRTLWNPDTDSAPHRMGESPARYAVRVDLSYDKEKAKFVGKGMLAADGEMCPFSQMSGLESEAKTYLGGLAASVLKGTTVTEYNPGRFEPEAVSVGFMVELPKPEPDDFARTVISIGRPKDGVFDHLPHDLLVYQPERQSTVHLSSPVMQRVMLSIDTTSVQVVHYPTPMRVENAAGQFSVMAEIRDGRLVVIRELQLVKTQVSSSEWPALRQLLLAEASEKNAIVMLKPAPAVAK
ncbi:MAG: DUF3857 domain-containing protein [Candidatus Zixiibacteriota bacterium]